MAFYVVLIYHLKMLNKQTYRLSEDVLLRYEESIDSGTFFIFNVITKELWCGNMISKLLVELVDGKNSVDEIKKKLSTLLNIDLSANLNISVDNILTELLEKRMIVFG